MFAKAFGICGVRAKPPDSWLRSRSCQSFFADDDVDIPVARLLRGQALDPESAACTEPLDSAKSSPMRTLRGTPLHPLSFAQKTPRTPGTGRNIRRLSACGNCPEELLSDTSSNTSESSGESYFKELEKCREKITNDLRSDKRLFSVSRRGTSASCLSRLPSAVDAELARRVDEAIQCVAKAEFPGAISARSERGPGHRYRRHKRRRGTRALSGIPDDPALDEDPIPEEAEEGGPDVVVFEHHIDELYAQCNATERIRNIEGLMLFRGNGKPKPPMHFTGEPHCLHREANERRQVEEEIAQEVRSYRAGMLRKFSRMGFDKTAVEPAELDPAKAVKQMVAHYHEKSVQEGVYWPGLDALGGPADDGFSFGNREELESYVTELRAENLKDLWKVGPTAR